LGLNKIVINPKKDLIFDLKVREMCKQCKRYGKKASCPPYVETVEYYSKLLPTYQNGIIYYKIFPILEDDDPMEVGKESSLEIWRKITSERTKLFNQGHYLIIGFGAGSCKICDECQFPCHTPSRALMPLEATGMDVVKVMKQFNVEVKFPFEQAKTLCRIGAIFYD
jgi:predicted metal-binding protein